LRLGLATRANLDSDHDSSPSPVPLWTPWGKGFKSVALRSALGPPSAQRPALGSYTTSWDANFFLGIGEQAFPSR